MNWVLARKAKELREREDAIAKQQQELEQLKEQQNKDPEKREAELQNRFNERLKIEWENKKTDSSLFSEDS